MAISVTLFGNHWRGALTLTRAFLVAFGTALLAGTALAFIRGAFVRGDFVPGDSEAMLQAHVIVAVLAILLVLWAVFGLWRSATRAARDGQGTRAAAFAKLVSAAVAVLLLHQLGSEAVLRGRILAVRLDPAFADYRIARHGADVAFTGALNERAAAELSRALSDPAAKVLRIESHGGLIDVGEKLAETIAARGIAVLAERQCLSTCLLLLAASPQALLREGTLVSFHRPASLPGAPAPAAAITAATEGYYGRFAAYGLAPWAVAEMSRREIWSPSVGDMAAMGLVDFVLTGPPDRLTPVGDYCRAQPQACAVTR